MKRRQQQQQRKREAALERPFHTFGNFYRSHSFNSKLNILFNFFFSFDNKNFKSVYTRPDVVASFRLSHWTPEQKKHNSSLMQKFLELIKKTSLYNLYKRPIFRKRYLGKIDWKSHFLGIHGNYARNKVKLQNLPSPCQTVTDGFRMNWMTVYRCSFEIGTNTIYHFTLLCTLMTIRHIGENQTIYFQVFQLNQWHLLQTICFDAGKILLVESEFENRLEINEMELKIAIWWSLVRYLISLWFLFQIKGRKPKRCQARCPKYAAIALAFCMCCYTYAVHAYVWVCVCVCTKSDYRCHHTNLIHSRLSELQIDIFMLRWCARDFD